MFASALPISLYEPTYKPQRTRELVFAPSPSQSVLPLRAERHSADDRTHVEQTLYAHHTSDRHTAHGHRPATHPAQRSRFPRAVFSPAHSNHLCKTKQENLLEEQLLRRRSVLGQHRRPKVADDVTPAL